MTGAGKTTLLDVLANRANFGIPNGEVCIDGHERDASFQRRMGYAQQEDIHLPTATVREALEFSALLRQPNASAKEKIDYVRNVIHLLDMSSYADAVVGVPGDGDSSHFEELLVRVLKTNQGWVGLNIEQRKRLTIGVELVTKPELLLFLGTFAIQMAGVCAHFLYQMNRHQVWIVRPRGRFVHSSESLRTKVKLSYVRFTSHPRNSSECSIACYS